MSATSLPVLDSSSIGTPPSSSSPKTPNSDVFDLRSTKSNTSLKSTWKERHDLGRGTVVKEGDLGDG